MASTNTQAQKATARPARTRAASPAKAAPVKATTPAAKAEAAAEKAAVEATPIEAAPAAKAAPDNAIKLVLNHVNTTRRFEVFEPDESSGVVGKLYFPLGTKVVKVLGTTE